MIVSDIRPDSSAPVIPALLLLARKRRYMLALPTLAGIALGVAGYINAPWSYVSQATLALDDRRIQALPTESVVSSLSQDIPALRTQLDIISSRMMAQKVAERLASEGVTLQVEPTRKTLLARAREVVSGLLGHGAAAADEGAAPATRDTGERQKIDHLLDGLNVGNDGRSYTIFISFRGADPYYAAKVANAFGYAFLDHQVDVQSGATRRVAEWLGEKVVNLRAQLQTSEQAVEDFRQKQGIAEMGETSLQQQRVSATAAELVTARANLAGAEARLETVRAVAARENTPALAEVLGSATIQSLRTRKAEIERQLDGLRDSGALKSARIGPLNAQLASLDSQIAEEVDRIVESLSNEIAIARKKVTALDAVFHAAQRELSAENHAGVTLAQLQRETNANRSLYESYLERYKQTIEQEGIAEPEAQMISPAEPAAARASPRLSTWLLFGMGLGGGLALAGVAFREAVDRLPRLPQGLEAATGIPVIGQLPWLTRRQRRSMAALAADASTPFGRMLSALRTVLGFTAHAGVSSALVITSAGEREGKTTLAVGLARSAVAAGMKAVVVDANMRKPTLAKAFGEEPEAFIDEILEPGRRIDTLLSRDPASEVRYIAARCGPGKPEALLGSKAVEVLVAKLKARFDLVIVVTPGLVQAPDALEVANAADRLLFVARATGKAADDIGETLANLVAAGHRPEGIVVTFADKRVRDGFVHRMPLPASTGPTRGMGARSFRRDVPRAGSGGRT